MDGKVNVWDWRDQPVHVKGWEEVSIPSLTASKLRSLGNCIRVKQAGVRKQ